MFDPAFFDSSFFETGGQTVYIRRPLVTTSGKRLGYRRRRRTARVR